MNMLQNQALIYMSDVGEKHFRKLGSRPKNLWRKHFRAKRNAHGRAKKRTRAK